MLGKRKNLTPSVGSDQKKAPVVGVGRTDFGGDQTQRYYNRDLQKNIVPS